MVLIMKKALERLTKKELIDKILGLQEETKILYDNVDKYKEHEEWRKQTIKKTNEELSFLNDENRELKKEVRELNSQVNKLKEERYELMQKVAILEVGVQKIKNERGAGRKKKYDDKQIAKILEARKENKSMRAIAKEFNCSLGLVQKIISEHIQKENEEK